MTPRQCIDPLTELLAPYANSIETGLERWLVEAHTPPELAEAMRYCVLGGGKRLRPTLVWMVAEAVGDTSGQELISRAASAVEMVHCYSLVHDDLPAMDDDTLRRGKPTAHVQFGEAMAILVGDALLTRAFGVLAESDAPAAARLCRELAHAAGSAGMVGGQAADMGLCEVEVALAGLQSIHMLKTAAIIRAATRMGAICGGADQRQLEALGSFGRSLGLMFQLTDDLMDATSSAERIGKTPGKDARAGKRTHLAELGIEKAQAMAEQLTEQAAGALQPLGERAQPLRKLATLLAERTH